MKLRLIDHVDNVFPCIFYNVIIRFIAVDFFVVVLDIINLDTNYEIPLS